MTTKKLLTIGSRAQVMHGTAKKTSGGLTKSQLKYNKQGKIVSKKASQSAKKSNNLVKAGWVTQKGVFGVTRRDGSPKQRHTKHLHVTKTSLKTKNPVLHKHSKY